jgi:hypothetical protein
MGYLLWRAFIALSALVGAVHTTTKSVTPSVNQRLGSFHRVIFDRFNPFCGIKRDISEWVMAPIHEHTQSLLCDDHLALYQLAVVKQP